MAVTARLSNEATTFSMIFRCILKKRFFFLDDFLETFLYHYVYKKRKSISKFKKQNEKKFYDFIKSVIYFRMSTKTRIMRDFADERRRVMYEANRHGYHGPRFARIVPEIEREDPLLTVVNDEKID